DKGDVALSLGGKNKQSKNVKLAYNKPTLINEIDLSPEGRPELEELKTEELKAEDVQDPKKPFASLPVIKADSGTSIVAEGDLSGLDSVVPQRKFAPRNKGSVAEVLTDDDFLLAKPEATPRGVAAIATPEPSPVPQPVTELPPKILPIATPEPKKARLPIQPVAPEDSTLVDYQRDIKPLTFSWESTVPNVHFYMLELSPEKKFTNILTRIAVDSAEGKTIRDQDGKRMQFELKVSPVYILYVPGLLGSVYKNKEIYWRVVPLDRDNNPVLRTKFLEMRRIGFKTSKTAEIIARDSLVYTKENLFTAAPSLSLQWSLKNAVPGSYQLVIASDPDFKAQICTKDVSKYSFKKGVSLRQQPEISGQQSRLDLTFNEDVKIDIRGECPLENLMKAKKPIYYKIITFDPAEQKLPYSNGKSATGKFEFKE
ncbi:MAG TPA: hypothetical protein VFV50_09825, partial [Bdellovibrionales bacterium]|nr:hypothetical protein [Bdellovibrionales bacterium]